MGTLGPIRYFVADGGSGGDLLARLPLATPLVQPVDSARHANLLLAFEPISERFSAAIVESFRAMPRPRARFVVPARTHRPTAPMDLASELLQARATCDEPAEPQIEPKILELPPKHERDIATELVIFAVGPLQQLTVGPMRFLLVCDGEQVISAEVESGYANRDLATRMSGVTWRDAAAIAQEFDPLAPEVGEIAFLSAMERLRNVTISPAERHRREAVLARRRIESDLLFAIRFLRFLRHDRYLARLIDLLEKPVSSEIEKLERQIARDRFLQLRLRNVGHVSPKRLREAGVTGPNLRASEEGGGDVLARLIERLRDAANAPPGETARGIIRLHVRSADDPGPTSIEWSGPSAAVVNLLPEVLAGQKLADAEAIIASFDIAAAEVDA